AGAEAACAGAVAESHDGPAGVCAEGMDGDSVGPVGLHTAAAGTECSTAGASWAGAGSSGSRLGTGASGLHAGLAYPASGEKAGYWVAGCSGSATGLGTDSCSSTAYAGWAGDHAASAGP